MNNSMKRISSLHIWLVLAIVLPLAAVICAGCAPRIVVVKVQETGEIKPGEQAPVANPGQNNFGGGMPADSAAMAAFIKARMREPEIGIIHFNDLAMSDPYIYAEPSTKTYYLTSSGGRMYKSKDLAMWEGPYNIVDIKGLWLEKAGFAAAAEIHKIGKYYYYAGTWSDHSDLIQQVPRRYNVPHNQTYLLRSENPEGPYKSFAVEPGYDYQPRSWDCIDGTLYEEDEKVYEEVLDGVGQAVDASVYTGLELAGLIVIG